MKKKLSKFLATIGFESRVSAELADERLRNRVVQVPCTDEQRCRRDACFICSRSFRRHLVAAALDANLHRATWTRLNIITKDLLFRSGTLGGVDPSQLGYGAASGAALSAATDLGAVGLTNLVRGLFR